MTEENYNNNIMRLLLHMMTEMTPEEHNNIKLIHATSGSSTSLVTLLIGSVRLATHWRLGGHVTRGDVVTISLNNCPQYYIPVFAAWLCGAGVSLTDPTVNIR